jgi:hypothetical protein
MSRHLTREIVALNAEVRTDLLQPITVDRTFELPRGLYIATGSLYLGFVAVMAVGLSAPGLIIPLAICAIFIGMFFAVPTLWTRMRPDSAVAGLSWDRFRRNGIATLTGRLDAGEAAVQVLMLPALIFAWGIAAITVITLT